MKYVLTLLLLVPTIGYSQWRPVQTSTDTHKTVKKNFDDISLWLNRKLDRFSNDIVFGQPIFWNGIKFKDGTIQTSIAVSTISLAADLSIIATDTTSIRNSLNAVIVSTGDTYGELHSTWTYLYANKVKSPAQCTSGYFLNTANDIGVSCSNNISGNAATVTSINLSTVAARFAYFDALVSSGVISSTASIMANIAAINVGLSSSAVSVDVPLSTFTAKDMAFQVFLTTATNRLDAYEVGISTAASLTLNDTFQSSITVKSSIRSIGGNFFLMDNTNSIPRFSFIGTPDGGYSNYSDIIGGAQVNITGSTNTADHNYFLTGIALGKTSQSYKLDVLGGGYFSSSVTANSYYGDASHLLGLTESQIPSISTAVYFSSTDTITGAKTLTSPSGLAVTYGITAATGTFSASLTASTVTVTGNAFSVGGSTLVVSNGRVGIGDTAPQAKLVVNGNIVSSGTLSVQGNSYLSGSKTCIHGDCSDPQGWGANQLVQVSGYRWPLFSSHDTNGTSIFSFGAIDDNFVVYNDTQSISMMTLYGQTQQAYFPANVSALSYTDRTDYPDTKEIAYAAILSIGRKVNGKGVDHEKMTNFVRNEVRKKVFNKVTKSTDTVVEYGRNLTATVSAQNEVIKDLIKRIEALEKK